MEDFQVLYHSSIKIGNNIYIDPFKIQNCNKAKYIFITHSHYDHYSLEDIIKLYTQDTTIVATQDVVDDLNKNDIKCNWIVVEPNTRFKLEDLVVETFESYNINKQFHLKQKGWVGYKLTINNRSYIITGDSDLTEELQKQKCDVLFVPIGGTYTMDAQQAAQLTNIIKPSIVVPTHYNAIVGDKNDEQKFLKTLDRRISYKLFL
jgi:L-ascorbate metabolism protein UlaG (beta-lactamase superfamily)